MKKSSVGTVVAIIVFVVLGAIIYVYQSSQQKPDGVYVASDTNTATVTADTGTISNTSDGSTQSASRQFNLVPASVIGWKATKPGGFHTGTVGIIDGYIRVENGMIQAGQFRADMNSLQLMDIDNEKLEQEIRDDFFESTKHPTATFSLTRTYASGSQTMVEGNLTIKDVMNPIVFPATVSITDTQVKATAQFAIDADKWNLNHREGKVNRYLEFDLDFTRQPAL